MSETKGFLDVISVRDYRTELKSTEMVTKQGN